MSPSRALRQPYALVPKNRLHSQPLPIFRANLTLRDTQVSRQGSIGLVCRSSQSSQCFLAANRLATVASTPGEAAHLSIVVLSFTNLSNDPGQDYFADGIAENLTTDLSRIRDSFVIARNTASTFKGKNLDAKEIGKELGVRYVLEGSVQRDQTRVRVNAQLIDAQSGALGRTLRRRRSRFVQAARSGGGAIGKCAEV